MREKNGHACQFVLHTCQCVNGGRRTVISLARANIAIETNSIVQYCNVDNGFQPGTVHTTPHKSLRSDSMSNATADCSPSLSIHALI